MTIWKNATELGRAAASAAVSMAGGVAPGDVAGSTTAPTISGAEQPAILLEPFAITRGNLNLVVDADWISKDALCNGVGDGGPTPCN